MGALVALLGQVTVAAAAIGPLSHAGATRPWSAEYMNGPAPVGLAQALADARDFNVAAAHSTAYAPYVKAMKLANPNLKLFVYMKGVLTTDTSFEEDMYAHDANGKRIQGVQYPGTWLLDPTSPRTLKRQLKRAQRLLDESGYDGVFLDTMGTAPLGSDYVTSPPVNPVTGKLWTQTDWIAATSALAGKLAAAIGEPVIGNGLRDGQAYFSPGTEQLLRTGLTGAMAEGWLRGADSPITTYPDEATWKLNVDAVVDAGAHGGSFLAVTKLWEPGTQAQKDAWYTFAVASFLLANDGQSFQSVTYLPGDASVKRPLDGLDLGTPTGAYAKVDNVYQRGFSGGRVLVNPGTTTTTVQLDHTYHALDGSAVTSVTLAPHSAAILTA
jgi:hypothetical protein